MTGEHIMYYKSSATEPPKGEILMRQIDGVYFSKDKPLQFIISTNTASARKYALQVEAEADAVEWMAAITMARQRLVRGLDVARPRCVWGWSV